jgi:ketosteroid isomerase-like protein
MGQERSCRLVTIKLILMKYMIIAGFLFFCACDSPSGHQAGLAQDSTEVRRTLVDMWDAIEHKDMTRYAEYVHPDFTQFGETDSVLRVGKNAEVAAIRDWVSHASNIHTDMIDPRVTVKGDVAWVTYYWSDHGEDGGKTFHSRGKSTRIFLKEAGKWRCIHGHYTLLP